MLLQFINRLKDPIHRDRVGIPQLTGLRENDLSDRVAGGAGGPWPRPDAGAGSENPFDRRHQALASAYVYCRRAVNRTAKFHARKFGAGPGLVEDPATGAAVAALSGAIHRFDLLPDGHHPIIVEQGLEMGRPSFIHLHIDVEGGEISNARIGGHAVRLASGTLDL